jgi:hypothetical protein
MLLRQRETRVYGQTNQLQRVPTTNDARKENKKQQMRIATLRRFDNNG